MRRKTAKQLTADQAATVRCLAAFTDRPASEVLHQVSRTWEDWQKFIVAVSLCSDVWDYLDGETGQWITNEDKQEKQLRSYAATLFGGAPYH